MNPIAARSGPAWAAGGSDWREAETRVRQYFLLLGLRDSERLRQCTERVLARARERAAAQPHCSELELAMEEQSQLLTEWFAAVLERIPTGVEELLSTRGRLAMLLVDVPGRWQSQFLQPGPWPEEFAAQMRETYLRAGPEFQWSALEPRPLDLGPITTLIRISRLPYGKWLLIWLGLGLGLLGLFVLTR